MFDPGHVTPRSHTHIALVFQLSYVSFDNENCVIFFIERLSHQLETWLAL